jgi:hypothetical protein
MIQKPIWVFFVETVKKDDQRFEKILGESSINPAWTSFFRQIHLPHSASVPRQIPAIAGVMKIESGMWHGGHHPQGKSVDQKWRPFSLLLKLPQIKK